jgi:hypothetical protein
VILCIPHLFTEKILKKTAYFGRRNVNRRKTLAAVPPGLDRGLNPAKMRLLRILKAAACVSRQRAAVFLALAACRAPENIPGYIARWYRRWAVVIYPSYINSLFLRIIKSCIDSRKSKLHC